MARAKKVNAELYDVAQAVSKYQGASTLIRAKYLAAAEAEIAELRHSVQRMIAVEYADVGPSEMANSVGLSRSTVIRWRADWQERFGGLESIAQAPVKAAVVNDDVMTYGFVTYEGMNTAYIERDGKRLFLLTGEDFGHGDTVVEAEANKVDRPDWLTEQVMRDAIDATGAHLMLAPWK